MNKLWYVICFSFCIILTIIFSSWSAWHVASGHKFIGSPLREVVRKIAEFPPTLKISIQTILNPRIEIAPIFIKASNVDRTSWVNKFPEQSDDGYLLLSGVDPKENQCNIRLIRISDGKYMHQWSINFVKFADNQILTKIYPTKIDRDHYCVEDPKLLSDGSLIFHIGGILSKISKKSEIVWLNSGDFHHSVELDIEGNIWIPNVTSGFFNENDSLNQAIRDDAISKISPDGKLLSKESFSEILINNGFRALLLGQGGGGAKQRISFTLNKSIDPIHLNKISPALNDSKFWKKGDLLISARHLSTVFLYRPSNGKILWHQTGPWMNQHDARFINNHQISVFGNDIVTLEGEPIQKAFLNNRDTNQVYVYDFNTRLTTKPFELVMSQNRVVTITSGKSRILQGDRVFIEETNYGRHLMLSKNHLIWSRINYINDETIGLVHWSSYLTKEEVRDALKAFEIN